MLKVHRLCSLQTKHLIFHCTSSRLFTQETCSKEYPRECMQILNLSSSFLKVQNHLILHYFFHLEIYFRVLSLYARFFLLFLYGKLRELVEPNLIWSKSYLQAKTIFLSLSSLLKCWYLHLHSTPSQYIF